jgi:hypothetical protein
MIVCRLRWPAFLLLTGVIALLDQANILSWGRAWPLYLILFGVLALAERALAVPQPPASYPYADPYQQAGYVPQPGYQAGYPQTPGYAPVYGAATAPGYPQQPGYGHSSEGPGNPETGIVATSGSHGLSTQTGSSFLDTNREEEER